MFPMTGHHAHWNQKIMCRFWCIACQGCFNIKQVAVIEVADSTSISTISGSLYALGSFQMPLRHTTSECSILITAFIEEVLRERFSILSGIHRPMALVPIDKSVLVHLQLACIMLAIESNKPHVPRLAEGHHIPG